jgi:hypothetical protein
MQTFTAMLHREASKRRPPKMHEGADRESYLTS